MSQTTGLNDLIYRFQKEIKSLGGQSHLASGTAEIANIVLDVALHADCKLAIVEGLLIDGDDKIISALNEHGVKTVRVDDSQTTLELLSEADMGVTHADMAVSQTGTIIMKTTTDSNRLVSCLPRVHVALTPKTALVEKLTDATDYLKSCLNATEPCAVSFVSGPSRTSDIEMKQVLGVHGPHEVHVILYGE